MKVSNGRRGGEAEPLRGGLAKTPPPPQNPRGDQVGPPGGGSTQGSRSGMAKAARCWVFSDCDNTSWERARARCRRSALHEKHGFAILARVDAQQPAGTTYVNGCCRIGMPTDARGRHTPVALRVAVSSWESSGSARSSQGRIEAGIVPEAARIV